MPAPAAPRQLWLCPCARGGWTQVPPGAPAQPSQPSPLPRQTSQYTWPQLVRLKHDVRCGGWKQRLQNTQLAMPDAASTSRRSPGPDAAHAQPGSCTCADWSWSAAPAHWRVPPLPPKPVLEATKPDGAGCVCAVNKILLPSGCSGCSGCTCRGATRTPEPGLPHSIIATLGTRLWAVCRRPG